MAYAILALGFNSEVLSGSLVVVVTSYHITLCTKMLQMFLDSPYPFTCTIFIHSHKAHHDITIIQY